MEKLEIRQLNHDEYYKNIDMSGKWVVVSILNGCKLSEAYPSKELAEIVEKNLNKIIENIVFLLKIANVKSFSNNEIKRALSGCLFEDYYIKSCVKFVNAGVLSKDDLK
ncbi:hypothetical protein [Aliikangiella maris]|uniref:Uncharacterized protein n=2 Tax=Aliikangiella maris TaxID=3162458 RepID=A0ABV2BYF8_9GAMM